MADIRTFFTAITGEGAAATVGFGACDWLVAGAGLESDEGLQTAILISLFTDRRASVGDVPQGTGQRGWWGDSYAPEAGDQIGSRLWLLARSKQLPATLRQAEQYAREALQWLVDDGVAQNISATAEWGRVGLLGLVVQVQRSGQPVLQYRFENFWKGV